MNAPAAPSLSARLSHLAVFPACYTLGVYLLAVSALGLPAPGWATIAYLLLVAHACYLLDRVKLSDDRQDPADALAVPERALLYARHSAPIRAVLAVELCPSIVLGWLISPALALLPLCALLGVHLYAGHGASPGRIRCKDLPALKSFLIASAHLALVIAVLWGNDHNLIEHPRFRVVLALTGLWLLVSADATLCDLDDRDSDAAYGTRSLPVLLGGGRAWALAMAMLTVGSTGLIACARDGLALAPAGAAIVLTALPTRSMKDRRDLVDARLLPIALIAMLLR